MARNPAPLAQIGAELTLHHLRLVELQGGNCRTVRLPIEEAVVQEGVLLAEPLYNLFRAALTELKPKARHIAVALDATLFPNNLVNLLEGDDAMGIATNEALLEYGRKFGPDVRVRVTPVPTTLNQGISGGLLQTNYKTLKDVLKKCSLSLSNVEERGWVSRFFQPRIEGVSVVLYLDALDTEMLVYHGDKLAMMRRPSITSKFDSELLSQMFPEHNPEDRLAAMTEEGTDYSEEGGYLGQLIAGELTEMWEQLERIYENHIEHRELNAAIANRELATVYLLGPGSALVGLERGLPDLRLAYSGLDIPQEFERALGMTRLEATFPTVERKSFDFGKLGQLRGAAVMLLAALMLLGSGVLAYANHTQQSAINAANAEIEALRPQLEENDRLKKAIAQVNKTNAGLEQLLNSNTDWLGFLRTLVELVPAEIKVQTLKVALKGTDPEFTLTGFGPDSEAVWLFIKSLETNPKVRLNVQSVSAVGQNSTSRFVMSLEVLP